MSALYEHRVKAAEASAGTSTGEIKRMVLNLIGRHKLTGNFLDFGAGQGELARMLGSVEGVEKICAADIMARPADLPESITWYSQDLNADLTLADAFDVVICTEVIEHLENPREVFRNLHRLLRPGGTLLLTTPNQESIRSYVALLLGGHFVMFLGNNYPAHITALLRLDLVRICKETGFEPPTFAYTQWGGIPKLPRLKWQQVSFGMLRGRLFSDNIGMVTRKRSAAESGP